MSKTEEARPQQPLIAVMSPRDFARRLKVIADRRDLTMAEALDKYAGPAIDREYRKVVQEMDAEIGGEG